MSVSPRWWKSTDNFARSRYGVVSRSFFVPDTVCQARPRGGARPLPSYDDAERPQSVLDVATVPGTPLLVCLVCLALKAKSVKAVGFRLEGPASNLEPRASSR